jgi:outer membrane murein-binding lipoprotein Lpp
MRRPTSALVLCGALAMLSGCGGSANGDINRLEAQVEQLNSSVAELNDQIDALSDDLAETAEQTTTEQRRTARRLSLLARNTKALQSTLRRRLRGGVRLSAAS